MSANRVNRPTITECRSPSGVSKTGSSPKATRWRGTMSIRAGSPTIRKKILGCNWRESEIACPTSRERSIRGTSLTRWPTTTAKNSKTKQAPKTTRVIAETGPAEYTRRCFRAARKANPVATLLINDYRMDAAYEKVIENLVDENGKPLYDVIGLQSHMHGGAWSNRRIWEVCERFAKYGVPLHFTETTILSGKRRWNSAQGEKWPSTSEGEKYQAAEVARFYTMVFSHPAAEAITWWDFCDPRRLEERPGRFSPRRYDSKTGI